MPRWPVPVSPAVGCVDRIEDRRAAGHGSKLALEHPVAGKPRQRGESAPRKEARRYSLAIAKGGAFPGNVTKSGGGESKPVYLLDDKRMNSMANHVGAER